jgi:hypothetical protein
MSICKFKIFLGVIPRTTVNRGRGKGWRKRGRDGKEKGRR